MRILFITSGQLPVPAVNGGAVETLLENYIIENELACNNDVVAVSCYSKDAALKCKKYSKTQFLFVPYRLLDRIRDYCIFFWHSYITKNWRVMFWKNKWKKKGFEKFIINKIDFSKYDKVIVENNVSLLPSVKAKMGKEEFKQKCYYHMHSVLIDNPLCIPDLIDCRAVLTVSEFIKKQICIDYPELNNAVINVVKNGINKQLFCRVDRNTRNKIRQKFSYSDKDKVFLYVGRISPEKGVLELIHAFKNLKISNKKLLLAGCSYQGEKKKSFYEKKVEAEIRDLPDKIKKIGYIANDKVSLLYNMADVMVIPSIVGDAGPLNLLEAMSCGMKIVASRMGGIPEYSRGYSKVCYVEYDENFEGNITQKMNEIVLLKDMDYAKREFKYDRKFYYNELNRELIGMGDQNNETKSEYAKKT